MVNKGTAPAQVVSRKLRALICTDPNSFWESARHEFGIALQSMSLELMDEVNATLGLVSQRISRLEQTTKSIIATRDAIARVREIEAGFAAEQERCEKSLLSQWLQIFVAPMPMARNTCPNLGRGEIDAIDFAFCRYALNVAMSTLCVSPEKIVTSRVLCALISIIEGANACLAPRGVLASPTTSAVHHCL